MILIKIMFVIISLWLVSLLYSSSYKNKGMKPSDITSGEDMSKYLSGYDPMDDDEVDYSHIEPNTGKLTEHIQSVIDK